MNKYLIETKIGWLERDRRDVLEANSIDDAITLAVGGIKASYPSDEIVSIESRRLYQPCQYCFTEQIECVGCPNMNCPGKKK
jgi:hypothetical protein